MLVGNSYFNVDIDKRHVNVPLHNITKIKSNQDVGMCIVVDGTNKIYTGIQVPNHNQT